MPRSHIIPLAVLLLIFSTSGAFAQTKESLAGDWEGAVIRDGSIQLVNFHFEKVGDSLTGSFDDPEMGIYEQPATEISVVDSVVKFRMSGLYGVFTMFLHSDIDQMTGGNDKWGPPLKMHLKRIADLPAPFYAKKEIRIDCKGATLAATLYSPIGPGPFPAAVIIPGSGNQTRELWEYRSQVYGLVRRGIAALIYDKRGVGKSTGDSLGATFQDLAGDVLACIAEIQKEPNIAPKKVGLCGISQGGWIGAIAAAKSDQVVFLILLQGPAVSTQQQELDRVEYGMRSEEYPQGAIDSALAHTRLYFQVVNTGKSWKQLAKSVEVVKKAKWAEYAQQPVSAADPDLLWWKNNNYDPAKDLNSVRCPVRAIFGRLDTNVPPATNQAKMEQYLTRAGVKHDIVVIPELAHAVATYQTLRGGKWDWPNSFWVWSYRPAALDTSIAGWVLQNSR